MRCWKTKPAECVLKLTPPAAVKTLHRPARAKVKASHSQGRGVITGAGGPENRAQARPAYIQPDYTIASGHEGTDGTVAPRVVSSSGSSFQPREFVAPNLELITYLNTPSNYASYPL